ncbi:MAG: AAA family ATPase [Muribaculaceae bacterium]|nr:AAA family ATPase [Muribaculaceae bacterium]
MKRKIYNTLLEWRNKYSHREALMIDGARRVGKSWIAEELGKNEYKSYILVNFSKMDSELQLIFDHYLSHPDDFFRRLQLYYSVKLHPRESLIIFDEVQLYPKARQAIKWLVEDGRFDYLETGSLMSIRENTKDIVIPSEERHIEMFPMDFEEYLWAKDLSMLPDFIRECFEKKKSLGQALHRKVYDNLREYMIVGGMPQAVAAYISSGSFEEADNIKRNILQLYRNDIFKYSGEDAEKVIQIWDSIPGQLQKHEKRFRISAVKKGARKRTYANSFLWLQEAMVVNTCWATTEPNAGLKLGLDDTRYKIYMGDTGLLISHSFDTKMIETEQLYRKLMLGKLEINSGMLVENLVAQMLKVNGHPLFYFSKSNHEDRDEEMEIDFLIQKPSLTNRHNINALEVKSTTRTVYKSLEKFKDKYGKYLNQSIILYSGDLKEENDILFLPLYMTICL